MPTLSRPLGLFTCVCLLLLAVLVSSQRGGVPALVDGADTAEILRLDGDSDARQSVDPAIPGQAASDQKPPGPAPLGVRASGPAPSRPAPSLIAQRRAQFESAQDLYAFANALAPAVRAGEPEAMWMLSRVYEYCSAYAMEPATYGRDTQVIEGMQLLTSQAMVAARARTIARCARFVPRDDLSYPTIRAWTAEAAEAGSLPAEADLLASGEPLDASDEYRRDLVDRVQRSADPESYAALAPAMGMRANGDRAFYNKVAGSQFAQFAWQIAACDLGMDCSPDSALMTTQCANGGICSQDPGQDFRDFVFDAAVPVQGAELVDEMVDSLLSEEEPK